MRQRHTLLLIAVAAVVLGLWAGARAAGELTAAPTAVGVVDIEKVFSSLKKKEAIEADLRTEGDKLAQKQNAMKTQITEMQNALDLLPPGGEAHAKKRQDLEQQVIELQVWGQFQQRRLESQRAIQIEKVYRQTLESIGQIAEENGYDLVLFKEGTPNFQGANVQQISALLQIRKVLWSKPSIDLTDQIITRMNNDYDAGN